MIQIVSYGGGTNSTAMVIGLYERGERPDAIVFADTGGEKPHTYEFLALFTAWCVDHGFPKITVVKGGQPQQIKDGSLEAECIRLMALPSKAYGYSSCSKKWKIDPAELWVRRQWPDEKTVKLIGFDADESHRAIKVPKEDDLFLRRFPLIEWGWGWDECVEAIARWDLPQPGKSACFFCPSSKAGEIFELKRRYPDLFERALKIESGAINGEGKTHSVKGLGRDFAWAELTKQGGLFSDAGTPEIDCCCYD